MKSFVQSQTYQVKEGSYATQVDDSHNGRPNTVKFTKVFHKGFRPNQPVNMELVSTFYKHTLTDNNIEFPLIVFMGDHGNIIERWHYDSLSASKRDADYNYIMSLFANTCPQDDPKATR